MPPTPLANSLASLGRAPQIITIQSIFETWQTCRTISYGTLCDSKTLILPIRKVHLKPLKRQSWQQQTTFININIFSLSSRWFTWNIKSYFLWKKIHFKHQAIFSSKDKRKKLKCRLLQFLFSALMLNWIFKVVILNFLVEWNIFEILLTVFTLNIRTP